MKIYLHIGTFKTGSTALQNSFTKNEELLKKRGIYWGEYSHINNNHENLAYGLLRNALIRAGIYYKYEKHPRFLYMAEEPKNIINKLCIYSKDFESLIISHESLFADAFRTLCGLEEIYCDDMYDSINNSIRNELKQLLERISHDIEIVCYLRRQDLFLESQYNQYCKRPWYNSIDKFVEFKTFIDKNPVTLDYYRVLLQWRSIFPKAIITIKPYEKEQYENNVIFDFYKNVLKFNEKELKSIQPINEKLSNIHWSRDVLEYKKIMRIEEEKLNKYLEEYSLLKGNGENYAYFTEKERSEFLSKYKLANNNVAKEFMHKKELFYDNEKVQEYMGLSEIKFIEITKYLLSKL